MHTSSLSTDRRGCFFLSSFFPCAIFLVILSVHACSVFWRILLMCVFFFILFCSVHNGIKKKSEMHVAEKNIGNSSNTNIPTTTTIKLNAGELSEPIASGKTYTKRIKKPCIMIFVSIYICVSNRLLCTFFLSISLFLCCNLFSNEGLTLFRSCM